MLRRKPQYTLHVKHISKNHTIYRITKNTIQPAQPTVTEHNVAPKGLKLHAG